MSIAPLLTVASAATLSLAAFCWGNDSVASWTADVTTVQTAATAETDAAEPFADIESSVRDDPDIEATLTLRFDGPPGYVCVEPGQEVTVILSMSSLPVPVRGFQAFMRFDSSLLAYVSGTYFLPDPFAWPLVYPPAVENDNIEAAAGISPFSQDPVQEDADLVTLVFEAGAAPGTTRVRLPPHDPPTYFSGEYGTSLLARLVNSQQVVITADIADPCGCHPPDLDGNGLVDLADHTRFIDCMSGPGVGSLPAQCACADLDHDDDVDLTDFAVLQSAFSTFTGP